MSILCPSVTAQFFEKFYPKDLFVSKLFWFDLSICVAFIKYQLHFYLALG